jgi:hypothetical protein
MDSTCFAFLRRDSGTFVQENSDYAWTAVLKTTSNFRGEGEMCIEFDYHHEDFEGKTESVYDFTYIQFADSDSTERMIGCYDVGGGIGASTADERDLLWKDTLRYLCTLQEDSGAYTVIVRHKGLVEYSFDGQEIWRLVEKE